MPQRHPSKIADQAKRLKVQIWSSIVNILIIEGRHLTDKDGEPLSKPYLRLRLVCVCCVLDKNRTSIILCCASPNQQVGQRKVQDEISDA
jgi:hypothetical protein